MRIALLTQSYPPMVSGAALVVHRLAQGLAGRGHPVLVLAASDRGGAYVEEKDGLRIARLRAWPNPLRARQRFLLWPRAAIAAELQRFQPEIFHAHDPLVLSLAGLPAARTLERPLAKILTLHQLPWFISLYAPAGLRQPLEALLWRYGKWLYGRFDQIVSPSQVIAELVYLHTQQTPQVISNGVDIGRFRPDPITVEDSGRLRKKYNLDPQLPIILYAGRIDVDKRVGQVVRAAAEALNVVKAQLLIAGDGRERASLIRLSERLGIQALSHFPGFVADDLPALYRQAAVFVTASEVEIQSSVALEAMACGLPVVAVRASSMPEFVRDGQTGYLAPPGDVKALAGRLIELLRDPDMARTMGEAGSAVARGHSQERAVAEHEQLYAALLKRGL